MKTRLSGILLFCLAGLGCPGGEEGLLFHADFDSYLTHAAYARGSKKVGGIAPDLQLRMSNGAGSRNAVILDNRTERIVYSLKDNFNPACGTVSLWVKPENWQPDSKSYKVFFQIREPGFTFLIYKLRDNRQVCFYIQTGKKTYMVSKPIADWKPGVWHKLDAVWDQSHMKLYVDGRSAEKRMSRKLGADFKMPGPFAKGSITLDEFSYWRTIPNERTAYDEVKIYDRVLSGTEILAAYEKVIPPTRKITALTAPLVRIPETENAVRLDGKLDPDEWRGCSSIPVINQSPGVKNPENSGAEFLLAHSGKTLRIGAKTNRPAVRFSRTERDSDLWLDDGMELHIHGADGKSRQFIISAGGAVFDAIDGKKEWNSGIRATVFRGKDFWSLEAEIPLKDLGYAGKPLKANFGYTGWFAAEPRFHSWSWLPQFKQYSDKALAGTLSFGPRGAGFRWKSEKPLNGGEIELTPSADRKVNAELRITDDAGKSVYAKKQSASIPFKTRLTAGRYILKMEAADTGGTKVFRFETLVKVKDTLSFELSAFPSAKQFRLDVNIYLPGCSSGTAALADDGGKILKRIPFQVKNHRAKVILPFPNHFPAGKYYSIRVAADKTEYSAAKRFYIPDLKKIPEATMTDHSVPAPWIQVTVKGKTVAVLDRVYSFGRSPFPSNIISRGQPVLAGEPYLLLNGRKPEWKNLKITGNHPDFAEVTAQGKTEGAEFKFRGELWFDGMYVWTVDLKPETKLKIDRFSLNWQVPAEAAKYLMTPYYQRWKNSSMLLRYTPDEDSALIWLSGYENGLAWWCESDAGFVNRPDEKQVELKRSGKAVSVRVNMISVPAELKGTASYTMMFQATPPKRPPRQWLALNTGFGHYGTNHHVNYEAGINPKAASAIRMTTTMKPVNDEAMTKFTKELKKKRGARLCIYTMPVHMASCEPEFPFLEQEWTLTPATIWNSFKDPEGKQISLVPFCPHTRARDLYLVRTAKLLEDHPDLAGLYYDICHTRSCTNPLHGCGKTDVFGKMSRRSIALGQRRYLMAVYKLHKKYGMNPMNHAHNFFYPFVHDFSDSWIPGERYFQQCSENPGYFYFEGIPPEEYQCAYNAEIRGAGVYEIIQLNRVVDLIPALAKHRKEIMSREYGIRAIAPAVVHNVGIVPGTWGNGAVEQYRKIKKAVDLPAAEFHPYWIDPAITSETPGICCSWYSWKKPSPYRVVLAAANSKRTPEKLALKIDWKKLGLDPENVILTDLNRSRQIGLSELQTAQLKGNHYILIGIRKK